MAQVFRQALAAPQQPTAYDLLVAELQRKEVPPQPQFTPDQVRSRISENNNLVGLGALGQLAGDQSIQGIGGQIFKKALGDRQERVTNRGTTDPLTGQTSVDPEYAEEKANQRRGQVLQQAVAYESKRAAEAAAEAQKARDADLRRELASAARGRAGQDAEMIDLKKEMLRAQIGAIGTKADAAETKAADVRNRAKVAADGANARAADMIKTVDKALDQTGMFTTGMAGSVLSRWRGGTAFDLRKTIDTLKANIGFAELNAMRQASPTGGALGQVAIRELDMLQVTLGNLDADQSEEQLRENLAAVRGHYDNWRKAVVEHAQAGSISTPGTPIGSPTPAPVSPGAAAVPAQPAPGMPQTPPGAAPVRRVFNPATGKLQ